MQPTSSQQLPLLEPKFHAPRLPGSLVARERLLKRLYAGQEQKLTLLCAPAGFGKTTLAGQWLDEYKTQHTSVPVAWISLDSSDNDLLRFWRYVIPACQTFEPVAGHTALDQLLAMLQPPFYPSALEIALTTLLNDLSKLQGDRVLVLDDYHVIAEASIHQSLTFFLDHLPAAFHVMILTRSEPPLPLVRWRASGELCEIHASDLRFSRGESEQFFQYQPVFSSADISQQLLDQLDQRLEGWAVGLRLFSLALHGSVTTQERALWNGVAWFSM